MNINTYSYPISDIHLNFEFDSTGPKGKIRKIVLYRLQHANNIDYFNLGFGDLNPKTGKIDDLVVTDNQDREKILATVAGTVLQFTQHFPDAMVYAEGSTPARTRLYQIAIAANWNEIEPLLHVFGYHQEEGWQPFRKNVNYQAFLVTRK